MTAKNRHKNNAAEKSPAPGPEDAPKKKTSNGTSSSSAPAPGSSSGGCMGFFMSALFYVTLIGAAGFAAFYLQQVVEEIRQTSAKHEKSAEQNAELVTKVQSVAQQVESLQRVVEGLESSLGITRGEMEGAIGRMKRGEVETRKVEEALHKLQNDLLRDLTQGLAEVKVAREKDFSSLESTVEQRLAEVSQSIKASVTEITDAQVDTQTQLSDLKARLGGIEDPALVKEELSAIVDTVAEIRTAKEEADASVDSLRQQISSVREELQTRNQEVSSLSQEVEAVRTSVQESIGRLKQSLSEAEVSVQTVKDLSESLEGRVEQTEEAVRSVESKLVETTAQTLKRSDELESRVRSTEQTEDSVSSALSDLSVKVESLVSKCDTHESSLAAQGQAVEQVKAAFEEELVALKSSVEELQSSLADSGGQAKQVSPDSDLRAQVEKLRKRLEAVESSSAGSVRPEQLQSLQGLVRTLQGKAAKLEGHEEAISALQKALKETTQTLASLSPPSKVTK